MKLPEPVHFVGISGIGMSALARILLQRGCRVQGSSDRWTALTERLAGEGARVMVGHAAINLGDARTVVASSAIAAGNPELVAARAAGHTILRRGELLAALFNEQRGIAIAGTHGKTTTTAMVATVLEAAGCDPTLALGGERVDTGTNARVGAGAWFVTESDESDGSFLELRPRVAVVTNVENDHISSDDELPALVGAFEQFLASLPPDGLAIVGADEKRSAALARRPRAARTMTFGLGSADLTAREIVHADFGTRFAVLRNGATLGTARLPVPGTINVLDSLPAIAVGLELGIPFETIARALATFAGVRRRFEFVARTPRMSVVDDYAHHPTAVELTIAAARANFSGPIVVAFQPHRYSRTKYLAAGFARALKGADDVVITDVYAASESPIPGIDARAIGEPLRANGAAVTYMPNSDDLPAYLLESAPAGALVLMLGAGSITRAAARLAELVGAAEVAHR
ncbi:MAG: UDP-N-acetylmuramate--L-alanine ligase [Vulcanimicrobiaceae bacterium]